MHEPVDRPRPTAAMLVIGDEILSGRTRDANMHHLAGRLTERGIALGEVRIVSDDHDAIVAALNALRRAWDHVFTSGGIGPTHDDVTADAVGAAFGVKVDVREDARALLVAHYARTGAELNAARLRMARVPDGARLIENPVSVAPGFSIGNVHVMAGVPKVFAAMVESVLPSITGGVPLSSASVRVDRGEGDIAAPLAELAARFGDLSFGSYPFQGPDGRFGANLVVRGADPARVAEAETALAAAFR
jgi:molybdenum cofactor synthesis domain-containing protein